MGGGGRTAAVAGGEGSATVAVAGGGKAEEEFAYAKTSVWWDIENCHVPRGFDAHAIAQNIGSALANMGYRGVISSISAYGDTNKIAPAVQHALSSTGVSLNHVPAGVKDASDKKILVDMLFWAVDNPPPANYLLISGDRDFSNALHQLRLRRYNILLAHAPNVSQALVAAAKCVWMWSNLLCGGLPLNIVATHNVTVTERSRTYEPSQSSSLPIEGPQVTQKSYTNGRLEYKQVPKDADRTRSQTVETPEKVNGSLDGSTLLSKLSMQKANKVPPPPNSAIQEHWQANHNGNSSSLEAPYQPYSSQRDTNLEQNFSKVAPHKFFNASESSSHFGSVASGSSSVHNSPPKGKSNNLNDLRVPSPQLFRPSDILSSQSTTANLVRSNDQGPGRSTSTPKNFPVQNSVKVDPSPCPPRLDGSTFNAGWLSNLPDVSKLKISDYCSDNYNSIAPIRHFEPRPSIVSASSSSQRNIRPQQNALHFTDRFQYRPHNIMNQGAVGCFTPPDEIQYHIGNILLALDFLKTNKMTPTEENIADCIHYGEVGLPNFDVRMGLDYATGRHVVGRQNLRDLIFYVRKDESLWKCVNIMNSNVKHPKATWDGIHKYISSPGGHAAMLATKCRYQAAIVLKKYCLKDLVLGEVLQILHILITVKRWIVPQPGWQPLLIKSSVSSDTGLVRPTS